MRPYPDETEASRAVARAAGVALCAVASGASVMIYEFLAVRILQRYFGGSLDVWGSVVAVCLAGLSLGYFLGGALSDRYGSWRLLGFALAGGGAAGLFMEPLADWTGKFLLEREAGMTWHPHVAALVSSFLPIFALGMVLPVAIRLKAQRLDRVGSSVGWIAAVSTMGSIAGVLATTMLLLPRWGVRDTLHGTSALLIALGVVLMALPRRRLTAAGALAVLALAGGEAAAQIRYEDYSAYHHIIVEDADGTRVLRFDTAEQTTMSLADPYSGAFEYTDFFHVPKVLNPTLDSVLFLGLGGGSGPKSFLRLYPKMRVYVAELDPVVEAVAREYFVLSNDPRLSVTIADGRTFLQRSRRTFGIIVADAYASGPYGPYLPNHMATLEFFQVVWSRLPSGGGLVYNIIGLAGGDNAEIIRDIRATIAQVFQAVYTFQAASSGNTVVVAMKLDPVALQTPSSVPAWPKGPWLQHPASPAQLAELARVLMASQSVGLPGMERRIAQFSPIQDAPYEGRILTDDFAPVDLAPGLRQ